MSHPFSNSDLEAFLDEALPTERMAAIEDALRNDGELQKRITAVNGRRDAGVHSLGEIWRRHRLSCPSRDELGSFLLGVLPPEQERHLALHLETVGCRYCQSNLQDLRSRQAEAAEVSTARRKRYFQSSAGYLKQR